MIAVPAGVRIVVASRPVDFRNGLGGCAFRDLYQDALRELVEAKTKGLATTPRAFAEPPQVISPTEALERSLAQDAERELKKAAVGKPTRGKAVPDRRHRAARIRGSGEDGRAC